MSPIDAPVNAKQIRRALLSVTDKTGLIEFARVLGGFGVELVSTGGTAAALRAGWADGQGDRRADRISRDAGRTRQNASSQRPRRPALHSGESRARGLW